MKLSTKSGPYACTVMNKMKQKGHMHSKGPVFSVYSAQHPFWTNFELKYAETLALVDNILQKFLTFYELV